VLARIRLIMSPGEKVWVEQRRQEREVADEIEMPPRSDLGET
jgi:hypothetical protein